MLDADADIIVNDSNQDGDTLGADAEVVVHAEIIVNDSDQDGDVLDSDIEAAISDPDQTERDWKPEQGMMFDSYEEAEFKITKWATSVGFQFLRGHSKTGKENLSTYHFFYEYS